MRTLAFPKLAVFLASIMIVFLTAISPPSQARQYYAPHGDRQVDHQGDQFGSSQYKPSQPYYRTPRQRSTANNAAGDPSTLIREIVTKLKHSLASDKASDPDRILGFLQREIVPHIAFSDMTRWIVGTHITLMSQKDLKEFEEKLKTTFLSALAKHLGSFNMGETRIRIYPARYRNNGQAIVRARVFLPRSYFPVNLDFRVLRNKDSWQLIDVKANGVSALIYYRNYFQSRLSSY